MSQGFFTATREAAVQAALDLDRLGDIPGTKDLLEFHRRGHGKDVDKTARRAQHQSSEKSPEGLQNLYPAAHLVVQRFEMLQVSEHLFDAHDPGDTAQAT